MAKKSTRLEELHNTFCENGISPETIMQNDGLIKEIKKHADTVPDYRHPSYVRHLLGGYHHDCLFCSAGECR